MSLTTSPYKKYRDSGSKWLGAIPSHWDTRSLGSLISSISKKGRSDLPLLSVVRERGIILRSSMSQEENRNVMPEDLSKYKVVNKGNLVINKMKAWQGSLGISPYDGVVSPAYYVFEVKFQNKRYLHYLLRCQTYVDFFAQSSDGVRIGQWDLSITGMKRIPITVPPEPEQALIVRYVSYFDVSLVRLITQYKTLLGTSRSMVEKKKSLIYEYRTRLIADVVTGKLDVRELAASLPDEVEEPEPLDATDSLSDAEEEFVAVEELKE